MVIWGYLLMIVRSERWSLKLFMDISVELTKLRCADFKVVVDWWKELFDMIFLL